MSDNPYLVRGDEWWINPDMEIVPDAKDVEIERLLARVAVLERACRLIQADPDPHAVLECTGCLRHSRLAFHALEAIP
jgi:hypothetical protein